MKIERKNEKLKEKKELKEKNRREHWKIKKE